MPLTQAGDGLGRVFNVVYNASGVGLYIGNCNAVTFLGVNDNTYTLSIATTFAGTYRAANFFTPTWAPLVRVYTNADNGVGTGAWTKVTQAASAAVVTATDIAACFTLYTTTVPDTYRYVKCTQSAPGDSGVIVAILHDLAVQRTPANLQIVAA